MGVVKPKKKNKIHFVYLNKPEIVSVSVDAKGVKRLIKSIKANTLNLIDLEVSEGVTVKGKISNCITGKIGSHKIADKTVYLREKDLVVYLISSDESK